MLPVQELLDESSLQTRSVWSNGVRSIDDTADVGTAPLPSSSDILNDSPHMGTPDVHLRLLEPADGKRLGDTCSGPHDLHQRGTGRPDIPLGGAPTKNTDRRAFCDGRRYSSSPIHPKSVRRHADTSSALATSGTISVSSEETWIEVELEAYQLAHSQEDPPLEDPRKKYHAMQAYWASIYDTSDLVRARPYSATNPSTKDATFPGSHDAAAYACQSLGETTTIVSQRIGDKNILPYMHVILAYLFGLAFVPNALIYVEGFIPWENITIFLNTLGRSGVVETRFEGTDFPQQMSGTGRQLPEDFVMRGLLWAQHYFPAEFFSGQIVDEDERSLELPSHAVPRAEHCLWLGFQLASLNRWIHYDNQSGQFSTTHFARSLENTLHTHTLESRSQTLSAEPDLDSEMIDVED